MAKSRNTAIGSRTIVPDGDFLGTIRFCGDDGVDLDSIGAQISAQVDGTPGADDMPGRLVFSTTADGASSPTERLRIDSSGRVGVGSTTPGAPLHVVGTIYGTTNIGIRTNSPTNNIHCNQDDSDASLIQFTNTTTGATASDGMVVGIDSSEQGVINVKENKPLIVSTNNTEAARIDSSGRLLVGASASSGSGSKIQVVGDSGLQVHRGITEHWYCVTPNHGRISNTSKPEMTSMNLNRFIRT